MRKPLLIFNLLALTACGETVNSKPSSCAGDGLVVSNAWVREAPEGQTNSAAYFSICNGGETTSLTTVSFAGAQATELHTTRMNENSVAEMKQLETILIPTGQTVALAPGGTHLMLVGLTQPLLDGDNPLLHMEFANGEKLDLVFEVRPAIGAHTGH